MTGVSACLDRADLDPKSQQVSFSHVVFMIAFYVVELSDITHMDILCILTLFLLLFCQHAEAAGSSMVNRLPLH